ncbi:MAG: rhomboid family intramembrane serine protease [Chitinophagaceae bacterium]|nr:rhomboid family intramembrane serine protease [Chitinophagaceae bacterium]
MPATTDGILSKPWTVLTHMFVHDNVWKVFANMLWLWCFGYIMQDMMGNKRLFPSLFMAD